MRGLGSAPRANRWRQNEPRDEPPSGRRAAGTCCCRMTARGVEPSAPRCSTLVLRRLASRSPFWVNVAVCDDCREGSSGNARMTHSLAGTGTRTGVSCTRVPAMAQVCFARLRTVHIGWLASLCSAVVAGGCNNNPDVYVCTDSPDADTELPEPSPGALINGFRSQEFQLKRDTESGTFVVVPPTHSEIVNCAVFVANPEFNVKHTRIRNGATAIARYQVFAFAERDGTLSFSLAGFEHPTSSTFNACGEPPARYRVEGLSLGCWALAGTRLVGATPLLELALSDLPQAQPPVDLCLTDDLAQTAGRLCALDAQLGVCSGGVCLAGIGDASVPTDVKLAACTANTDGAACSVRPPRDAGAKPLGRCRSGLCVKEQQANDLPADQLVITCSDTLDPLGEVRNGFSCSQSELGTFGTCYEGRCRRRCAEASDCSPAGGEFKGMLATETACRESFAGTGINVCVPPERLQ
jgi:hypothetical protein